MESTRSLVRAVEVWVPRGEVLVPSSGAYGEHVEFARVSARSTFRRGEGLPGAVWSTERALIWRELGLHFVRAEQARAAGIDAALAMPVYVGSSFRAVIVFLMSKTNSSPGCVELWDVDADLRVLKHAGGHYCGCPDFATFSPLIQFPFGTGLPGGTWAADKPFVIRDVRRANTFIRAGLAARSGLKFGVGLPVRRGRSLTHVMTLVAAEDRPFVQAFELWEALEGTDGARLALRASSEAVDEPAAREAPGEALAAEVLASGLPKVVKVRALEDAPIEGDAAPRLALGIPMEDGMGTRSAACLVF
jgi:hypothetical protein